MQLLGIFINNGDRKVIKNLRKNTFYPFIDLKDFDYDNFSSFTDVRKRLEYLNKNYNDEDDLDLKFTNYFYTLNDIHSKTDEKNPVITLNCIVGKNGSGKSSLLNLEYRIINNLSCQIKSFLKNYNQGYEPVWSTGFNAELYYKLNKNVYCIQVKNNLNSDDDDFFIEEMIPENRKAFLHYISKEKDIYNDNVLFSNLNDENDLLERISKHFFYTVGTNYSIYSNSVVTDEWGEKEELWMRNIYHKNDGYFTPIVLVPYRNQWTTVDTKKELNLAKERLSTLSLLVYAQTEGDNKDFIEGMIPKKICFRLKEFIKGNKLKKDDKNEVGYKWEISKKIVKTIYGDDIFDSNEVVNLYKKYDEDYSIDKLRSYIRNRWQEVLRTKIDNCQKVIYDIENLDGEIAKRIFNAIKDNTVEYLTYKLIKMILYYDKYRTYLLTYDNCDISKPLDNDILSENSMIHKTLFAYKKYFHNESEETNTFYEKINIITDGLLGIKSDKKDEEDFTKTDFINLKVKQCIAFLHNLELYINKNTINNIFTKTEINVSNVIDSILNKKRSEDKEKSEDKETTEELNYDFIFQNLLPPYFNKELYYVSTEQKEDNAEKQISDDKSGIKELVSENGRMLASLSSGESQLLNALSYAIYHIKNAASSKIKYKNINLVFDEAELYYHPEYQRSFIKDLLGIIKRSNLTNVDSINITIVTHSPFILSDIPEKNLLCLQDGKMKKPFSKTLGANFYDLLQNQFFMESSTGSIVEDIINTILDDYKKLRDKEQKLEEKETEQSKENDENKKETVEENIGNVEAELIQIKSELKIKYKENTSEESKFYNHFLEKLADEYLQSTLRNLIGIMIENDFFARKQQQLIDKIKYIEKLKK